MSNAVNAWGTLFKIGSGGSAETFTTIPEVTNVNAPNVKTDLNDVSSHDSPGAFREWLPGMHDGDTVTAPYWWRPSNSIHISVRVDAYASTLRNFKVVFPDASDNTCAFKGYINTNMQSAKVGSPLDGNLGVKVTGLPVWS